MLAHQYMNGSTGYQIHCSTMRPLSRGTVRLQVTTAVGGTPNIGNNNTNNNNNNTTTNNNNNNNNTNNEDDDHEDDHEDVLLCLLACLLVLLLLLLLLRLQSANPLAPPVIDPKYFSDPEGQDIADIRNAVRLTLELAEQPG